MSALHTPGPWRYDYEIGYCGELIAADGTCIATFTDEPSEQDARLIAAAPELLEALRRCRFDSLNMSLADLEFCRAAYAKATEGPAP